MSLSYFKVERKTVLLWLMKAVFAGALVAFVFAMLTVAGVKYVAF